MNFNLENKEKITCEKKKLAIAEFIMMKKKSFLWMQYTEIVVGILGAGTAVKMWMIENFNAAHFLSLML